MLCLVVPRRGYLQREFAARLRVFCMHVHARALDELKSITKAYSRYTWTGRNIRSTLYNTL